MDQLDKIIKKLNKLSLPIVILIASLVIGGFYYASEVNKQRSIERQQEIKLRDDRRAEEAKAEQEKQEQLKEQQANEEAKRALNTCIFSAEENYHENWFRECKSQGKLTSRCISLHDMTFDEYAKQNNIPEDKRSNAITDFYKEKDECSCRLPLDNADRKNKALQDDKNECFKKYPQK